METASTFHTKEQKGFAEKRYEALSVDREPFLDRARRCAKLTIPYLIPEDDIGKNETLPSLYQSVGANGVTNLASKLLMTMLPPNEPCFRLRVNNLVMEQQEEQVDEAFKTQVEKGLSRMEQAVLADIEEKGDRSVVYEGNQHLIVSGNGLYFDDPDFGLRFFPLSRFVVSRDPSGNPIEIITKEVLSINSLDSETKEQVLSVIEIDDREYDGENDSSLAHSVRDKDDRDVDIFTYLHREDQTWTVYQECKGVELKNSRGTYKVDTCPFFPVRMYSIAGESYGRSFVEMQLGDLTSLESLRQALVEGAAISALAIGMVKPNGVTSSRAVTEARNGDFIEGDVNDVQFLQVQKGADLRVAMEEIHSLEMTLKSNFLMMEGVRRDGERVTAEEIRTIARELEAGLGGVYTLISQEFQLPYIRSRIHRMTKQKKLPVLPKGVVAPSVVTGFEALGRGNDKQKLMEFLETVVRNIGQPALQYLNVPDAIQRLASALGIVTEGLVKTEEEIQQEQQQAQQMAQSQAEQQQTSDMMGKVAPEVIRQLGNNPEMMQQMMGNMTGSGGGTPMEGAMNG